MARGSNNMRSTDCCTARPTICFRTVQLGTWTCFLLSAVMTIAPGAHAVSVAGLMDPASLLVRSSQELLSAVLSRMQLPDVKSVKSPSSPTSWALLIAGSSGWENYRHQADVYRAYHIVRRNGISPENIVTMAYDDIAFNESNPYPGLVFNEPGGPDVYQGVSIDYSGSAVSAETFLAVLLGNKTAVKGKGNGKVIASGPNDKVFVFYSDHGSVGLLKFPNGPDLTAGRLLQSLKQKFARKAYKQLVFYLESCYSGSMFSGMRTDDWDVFAVTAAAPDQLSYATNCRGDDSNDGSGIGWNSMIDTNNIYACLGDEFSVKWMRDSESVVVTETSLWSQYQRVKAVVMDSNVTLYGDQLVGLQPISNVQGATSLPNVVRDSSSLSAGRRMLLAPAAANQPAPQPAATQQGVKVSQLDADLLGLHYVALSTSDPVRRTAAEERYRRALVLRQQADKAAEQAAFSLLRSNDTNPKVVGLANSHLPEDQPTTWAGLLQANNGQGVNAAEVGSGGELDATYVSQLVYGMNGRQAGAGKPLVDDWDCFQGMIDVWSKQVSIWTNYARRHTRFFANLCNAGVTPQQFKQALKQGGN